MMKQLPLLILTMIGFSCGNKPETSTTDSLKIKMDTLMVDAGEEILYLEGADFALAPDGKYLYNFNQYDHTLEKIDLEERRLLEKLPFEKEGPNGTVSPIYHLNMLDKNHVYLSDNPVRYFVREGDIWIFANIADELGFIRLAATF
ncbi:DUF4221 family protein [Cyclobacterium salsum]|uniref:DUF4221 family protein n=1 Tax=Cyclobacterium salsum TaxID=2666329 RepID=UPI0013919CA3|nr:DUF4221 family protein [Cyclobacterium salsum]